MTLFSLGLNNKRLTEIEQRLQRIENQLGISAAKLATFESSLSTQSGYDGDPGAPALPGQLWVSKSVKISEQLTSYDFAVKAQLGQALLLTLVGILAGAAAVALFDLVWYAALIIGLAVGAVALTYFILEHRGLLQRLVKDAGHRQAKKSELRVAIKQPSNHQTISDLTYLYLNGAIDRDDLRLIAAGVRDGKSLAVNGWIGVGGWTRTKLDNFLMELERMGYARPGRGNQPRMLTKQGQALFRALAER